MSLEVHYKSPNGQLQAKFGGNDAKDIFEQIAKFEEIFCNNLTCKNCNEANTRLGVREAEGNKYYERVCNKCGYKFAFGQHKKGGTLFPKYDKGTKGWHKWTAEDNDVEEETKPAAKGVKK